MFGNTLNANLRDLVTDWLGLPSRSHGSRERRATRIERRLAQEQRERMWQRSMWLSLPGR